MVASDLKTIGKPTNPIVAPKLATMWPSHCLPGCGQQSNPLVAWTKNHRKTLKMVPCQKTLPSHHLKKLTIVLRVWNSVHPSKGKVGKSSSPQKCRLRNAQGVVRHSSALCGPSYCLFFVAHVSFLGMELNCFHGNIFGEKGFGKYQVLFALLPMPRDRHTCNRI